MPRTKPAPDPVERLDGLVRAATPADGSAPLPPVIDIGNLVVAHWTALQAALSSALQPSGN